MSRSREPKEFDGGTLSDSSAICQNETPGTAWLTAELFQFAASNAWCFKLHRRDGPQYSTRHDAWPRVRSAMSKSPEVCPKCGHRFAEGSPDLSSCPSCGELCSSQRVTNPPPLPEAPALHDDQTPAERRRWRFCFWLCFLLTPAAVLLLALQPNVFKNVIPGSAGQFLRMMAPFGVVGTFAAGALGAGSTRTSGSRTRARLAVH